MLTNEREKKICEKYSKRDEKGQVHCSECPLNKTKYKHDYRCKAICHYDQHSHQWEFDGYWKNYEDLTEEEKQSGLYKLRPTDNQRVQLYYDYLEKTGKGSRKTTPMSSDFMNAMENWFMRLGSIAVKHAKRETE